MDSGEEYWKAKYLEARKSGYLEGLEEAALIAEKVARDSLGGIVIADDCLDIKPEDTVAWEAAQLIRKRMKGKNS